MNVRMTVLKSVNPWTQRNYFIGHGSKPILAFMSRTPNRGASPCSETVKTMTEALLSRCSGWESKGLTHLR